MKMLILVLFLATPFYVYSSCISCHESQKNTHYTDYSCIDCHNGIDGTSRKELAHYKLTKSKYSYFIWQSDQVNRGNLLIDTLSCRRCHTIGDKGGGAASRLDHTVKRLSADQIADAISNSVDQMPIFNISTTELADLVNSLMHHAHNSDYSNMAEVVHFGGGADTDTFKEKCGGCHRAVTPYGALGNKSLAPMLSGINTEYYPKLNGKQWDKKMLEEWVTNPRKLKPNTIMPIITLTDEEKKSVVDILW